MFTMKSKPMQVVSIRRKLTYSLRNKGTTTNHNEIYCKLYAGSQYQEEADLLLAQEQRYHH
jgi:hypothetical protein